jgi:hypothetical protein
MARALPERRNAGLACIAVLSILATGCNDHKPGQSLEFYAPTKVPYEKATLTIMGTDIPVKVDVRKETTSMVVFLRAEHGEVLEHEAYKFDPGSFSLWRAGGELYDPVIPLLQAPIRPNDSAIWEGKMVSAIDGVPSNLPTASRPATALIKTSEDKLNMKGSTSDVLRVDVTLSMDGGGEKAAERKLTFWFKEGGGLVKRDFASSSTRSEDGGSR